jgi:SAM-dependent methyltransferase
VDETFERRRRAFGRAAALYDRVRPSYPSDAARWMLGDAPCRVLDLGAGTGIFTRVLASLGHDVVAVEPDDAMRAILTAATPGVAALAGSAEAIPLPAGSFDAVVAAQAQHWFDNAAARSEIARMLRPGGIFAPLWNVRDESVAWVRELTGAAELEGETEEGAARDFGPLFGSPHRADFKHAVQLTADELVALVQSRSQYLIAGESDRRRIDQAVRALALTLPQTFDLPYVTVAYRVAGR